MDPIASPPLPSPALPSLKGGKAEKETAQKFEAVFLGQMAQLMLENVEQSEEFSGGHGEEMFRGMLAEKLGTEMARRGGVGLAPAVLDQIIKLQQGGATHG